MGVFGILSGIFWLSILAVVVYCISTTIRNVRRLKRLQRAHMERSEQMITVSHSGIEMPIRKGELSRFNSMNRKAKNAMVEDYLRHVRKGKVIELDGGIIFKKDLKLKVV